MGITLWKLDEFDVVCRRWLGIVLQVVNLSPISPYLLHLLRKHLNSISWKTKQFKSNISFYSISLNLKNENKISRGLIVKTTRGPYSLGHETSPVSTITTCKNWLKEDSIFRKNWTKVLINIFLLLKSTSLFISLLARQYFEVPRMVQYLIYNLIIHY